MPVLPLLRLTAGLHTSPLEAGIDHCVDCLNVFSSSGKLVKRSGMRPVRAIAGLTEVPYLGFGTGTGTEPSTVANSGSVAHGAGNNVIYIGASAAFNRASVYGSATFDDAAFGIQYVGKQGFTFEYWDGSAWTAVDACLTWKPRRISVSGNSLFLVSPFSGLTTLASAPSGTVEQLSLVLVPPSGWATKSIGGQTKYWLRIRGWTDLGNYPPTLAPASSSVNTTENRILHINVFRDRRGTKHTFIAYLFGADGRELRFELDGVVLSQSTGLQPNGSASAGTGARMFSDRTRVQSFYHAATDRVIGHVEGLGWFFLLATGIYKNSSGNQAGDIYSLAADTAGTDTPYQSVLGGLRSALPPGSVSALYDGRIFAADGQYVRWSSPGVYADIWPNDNEVLLADAGGNIAGIVAVGGTLAVFKRNSIWVGQSDGTADGYTFYPIPGNVGCVAPRSIAVAGNVSYFLAEDGVYSFDGQMVAKISGAIDDLINSDSFTSNANDAVGVFSSVHDQYRLYYRSPRSSDVFDVALYCDLYGHTTRVEGREVQAVSWWKQGRYNSTDYGFQATAIATDNTEDTNRVLIGDRYGVLWEADKGTRDGGSVVTGWLLGHRVGLGSSRKAVVRWLAATQKNVGNFGWTLKARPEGREDNEQTATVSPYSSADDSVFEASDTFTAGGTFAYASDQAVVPNSFVLQGRWFQLELVDNNAAPWELDAIEVEVNTFGRRR